MIIYTCPECGHDLLSEVLTCMPPIYRDYCPSCGWSHSKQEEIVRVPFGGNNLEMSNDNSYLNDFLKMGYSEEDSKILVDLSVSSAVTYDGMLDITEAVNDIVTTINNVEVEKLGV